MEARYFEKVTEVNSLVKEIEIGNEKTQSLTEYCESVSVQVDVFKDMVADLTESYESERRRNKDIVAELEVRNNFLHER